MMESSMPSKKAPSPPASFEDALDHLNAIIEKMESGEMPLDEIIQSYEEGMGHLKFCREKLKAAELKIEQLQPEASDADTEDGAEFEKKDDIDLF